VGPEGVRHYLGPDRAAVGSLRRQRAARRTRATPPATSSSTRGSPTIPRARAAPRARGRGPRVRLPASPCSAPLDTTTRTGHPDVHSDHSRGKPRSPATTRRRPARVPLNRLITACSCVGPPDSRIVDAHGDRRPRMWRVPFRWRGRITERRRRSRWRCTAGPLLRDADPHAARRRCLRWP